MNHPLTRRRFLGAGSLLVPAIITTRLAAAEISEGQLFSGSNQINYPSTLDEQSKALLLRMQSGIKLNTLSVTDARKRLKAILKDVDIPYTEVAETEDQLIAGPNGPVPIRIYWPAMPAGSRKHAVLMLYHGGGFVLGDIDTHDNMARYFCRHGNVIVVNVGYRLAPEHKFPVAVEDCYAALCWVADNMGHHGNGKIAVIGDSAGGNLAAVISQLSKAENGPKIDYQVLLYPGLDLNPKADYESLKLYGSGEYFSSNKDREWFLKSYFDDVATQVLDPRASPIMAGNFYDLSPALIITAGFDKALDEARAYAHCLLQANVPVEYRCFTSTIHGFISFAGILDVGKEGLLYIAKRLRLVLS